MLKNTLKGYLVVFLSKQINITIMELHHLDFMSPEHEPSGRKFSSAKKLTYINSVSQGIVSAIGTCKFSAKEISTQYNRRLSVDDAISFFILKS